MKKFRAWEIHKKRYVDDMRFVASIGEKGEVIISDYLYELEEYTGYNDSNDKEIFEGDIVINEVMCRGVVYKKDGCYWVNKVGFKYPTRLYMLGNTIKVVGNVHENSNLLEIG